MALAQAPARMQQTYAAQQGAGRGGPSGLAEVLDVLLDKGLVIDVFVRVSVVGIELLTVDARVVVASVDTYLRFAEAVNRLDLLQADNSQSLGDVVGGGSRALSSRSSRSEPAAREEPKSGEDEPEAEHDEHEHDDEPGSAAEAARSGESGESAQDDKGLITRIKERGQVF